MAGKKGMHDHHLKGQTGYLERFKARVKVGLLQDRLQKHALGLIEMSTTQIQAAQTLLRKVVPDLSATELSGNITHFSEALERIAKQRHAAPLLTDRSVIEQPGDSVIH
jgi:chromosomal replication initiation ATPase DnaA